MVLLKGGIASSVDISNILCNNFPHHMPYLPSMLLAEGVSGFCQNLDVLRWAHHESVKAAEAAN